AKDLSTSEGRQAQRLLKRVADQLFLASGDTGLKVNKDMALEFDQAVKASEDQAVGAFKAASDKISEAQPGLQKALKASASRYQAAIDQQTRSQLFSTEATMRLSRTYDARGATSLFSGPTAIYQLF
ncbi:MAG TPA: hypothetical protein V6C82_07060, partial [Chroococcales cyanobacterium]